VLTTPAVQAQWSAEWGRLHGQDDPDRWVAAARAWAQLNRPYPVAYCTMRAANASLAAKDARQQASGYLRQAHEIASRLGARPLLEGIGAIAARARLTLPKPVVPEQPSLDEQTPFGLTSREQDVLNPLPARPGCYRRPAAYLKSARHPPPTGEAAMPNSHPVILVHGLFGWGPSEVADFPYWGTGLTVPSPLKRHAATVGPISSMHDRACELAYQIRGGQVDYGQEHSTDAGHHRYGRTYKGTEALFPQWSANNPVHLVGHSMGGPTIFLLQQLLANDFFGWQSDETWVASISSISGVLNGSTATYDLGCDTATGLVDPDTVADDLGHLIELFLCATGGVFDRFYDFQLGQWGLEPTTPPDPPEPLDS
jgi:hypothetical protein